MQIMARGQSRRGCHFNPGPYRIPSSHWEEADCSLLDFSSPWLSFPSPSNIYIVLSKVNYFWQAQELVAPVAIWKLFVVWDGGVHSQQSVDLLRKSCCLRLMELKRQIVSMWKPVGDGASPVFPHGGGRLAGVRNGAKGGKLSNADWDMSTSLAKLWFACYLRLYLNSHVLSLPLIWWETQEETSSFIP